MKNKSMFFVVIFVCLALMSPIFNSFCEASLKIEGCGFSDFGFADSSCSSVRVNSLINVGESCTIIVSDTIASGTEGFQDAVLKVILVDSLIDGKNDGFISIEVVPSFLPGIAVNITGLQENPRSGVKCHSVLDFEWHFPDSSSKPAGLLMVIKVIDEIESPTTTTTTTQPTVTTTTLAPPTIIETSILAWPTKDGFGDDTAIIPVSSQLPALIKLEVTDKNTSKSIAGEDVVFEIIASFGSRVIGQLRAGSASGTQVTAATNSAGVAEAFYFPTPISDFTGRTGPIEIVIRATHVKSGRKEVAFVKVGLGLELGNVKAHPTQKDVFTEGNLFALLIEMKSKHFPGIDLETYSRRAGETAWSGKGIGVQVWTNWLNKPSGIAKDDKDYQGPCSFATKDKAGVANFLWPQTKPSFETGDIILTGKGSLWPAVEMNSTGTHYYKLDINGIVIDSANKKLSLLELVEETAIFAITTFDYPSTFELVTCSFNPTNKMQKQMISGIKKVPVFGKWADGFLTVTGLLCDLSKGNFSDFALNLMKEVGNKTLSHLKQNDVFKTLTGKQQKLLTNANIVKEKAEKLEKVFKEGLDKLDKIPVSQQNSGIEIGKTVNSALIDPETAVPFNNMDADTLFDHALMNIFELGDYQSVTLWGVKELNVFRPGNVKVPLIAIEDFDVNTPLTEYILTSMGEKGGVVAAIIPKDTNYRFEIVPAINNFQMNVTSGNFTNTFDKYERSKQDFSITWNSQFDTLAIDATGDGFTDLNMPPELVDFNDIEVGPDTPPTQESTPTPTPSPTPSDTSGITIIGNISVGNSPTRIAVNPTTNLIYVTNEADDTISVIDGSTNQVVDTVTAGRGLVGIGVNTASNRIYVANVFDATVNVLDGTTNQIIDVVQVGNQPQELGVNSTTNRIYVGNVFDSTVSVIDGLSNQVIETVQVGQQGAVGIGVNSKTNFIYVSNSNIDGKIFAIDGSTNQVTDTISVGMFPTGIGVNVETNLIYVYNNNAILSVIDGLTNQVIDTIGSLPDTPGGVGVNTATNHIFAATTLDNSVIVIDGFNNQVIDTITVEGRPTAIGVNPETNLIYVANRGSNNVTVIQDKIVVTPTPEATPTPPTGGKSFTFNCEHSMKRGFFFGLETLTMNVGDTENCTLKLTKNEPDKEVEISSLLGKGWFGSSIKIEPARSITDVDGKLDIKITAIQKGTDWAAWAVPDDRGQFTFNKKSYDTGLAWGMFVEVK